LPVETIVEVQRPTGAAARNHVPLFLLLYGLTGFTGILAEQGFERYVTLLVGATASASAVVMFAYFLGFAIGGVLVANLLKNSKVPRPLLAYGVVELLVGVSCVAFSYSIHGLMETMAPLQNLVAGPAGKLAVRFICGCILVLPTASLMGASFPLMASALDRQNPSGTKSWSHAYAANLSGALIAALAAPFAILPAIGLRGALWVCAAICMVVFAVSASRYENRGDFTGSRVDNTPGLDRTVWLLLAASFASGAVFFALEVVWTHLIGLVIGCSIYAFSWMLASVLLGLLIGAGLVNRNNKTGRPMPLSRLFQYATLVLVAQLILWEQAPSAFLIQIPPPFRNSFYFAEIFKLVLTGILLVPCSTVLGLIYPRLLVTASRDGESSTHIAGYISGANALGCLIGALLGIFLFVPVFGSERSLKLMVIFMAGFWLLFLRSERPSRRNLRIAVVFALVALTMVVFSHWNWWLLISGRGNYFGSAAIHPAAAKPVAQVNRLLPGPMLFHQEDSQGGVTTVVEQTLVTPQYTRPIRTLLTNGKFQGDDNPDGQMNAQLGFAAIPTLFADRHDRVLLIGLGTGHSATVLRRLGYNEIHVAELAPAIVEAARLHFAQLNENVLNDPRVKMHVEDGRNVLLTEPGRRYDLITIEITSVWFAGATNVYSREFYELARRRLTPGGVLQQWVQLHHTSPLEVASDLATVRSVFPHVGLWYYGGQGMLIASGRPLEVIPGVADRFRASGMPDRQAGPFVSGLWDARLLGDEGVARFIDALHPLINTDHNRWIEYASPRYQASGFDWAAFNLRRIALYR
jgi:spermidine synthase